MVENPEIQQEKSNEEMSDEEAYKLLCEANKKLLNNYYNHQLNSMLDQTNKLYLQKDASFRGYRQ